MIDCILNVESWESLINIVSCILEDIASKIVDVRLMLRNKCPWALYVSKKTGRRWATFIARSKFKGYHFRFEGASIICTNLETGKQYEVDLNCCNCETFKSASPDKWGNVPPCEHMKLLQQLADEWAMEDARAYQANCTNAYSCDRPQPTSSEWAWPTLVNNYG